MWTPKHLRPPKLRLFPTTTYTIKVWDKFMHAQDCKTVFHAQAPLTALKAISPNLPLTKWSNAGITHIHQIVDNSKVVQFMDLQTKWQLPSKELFTYLRIKGIIMTHVQLHHTKPQDTL
ncbi:Hypothetical predicted protein, partial [Pelobates cultripes]